MITDILTIGYLVCIAYMISRKYIFWKYKRQFREDLKIVRGKNDR